MLEFLFPTSTIADSHAQQQFLQHTGLFTGYTYDIIHDSLKRNILRIFRVLRAHSLFVLQLENFYVLLSCCNAVIRQFTQKQPASYIPPPQKKKEKEIKLYKIIILRESRKKCILRIYDQIHIH